MNLIDIKDLSTKNINKIINEAKKIKNNYLKTNKFIVDKNIYGKKIINIFLENSTRTKLSFQIAQKNLNLIPFDFDVNFSSIKKNESFFDTINVIKNLGINNFILRVNSNKYWNDLEKIKNINIINAGTGKTSHPTQAIIDLFSILEHFKNITNLKILYIGDINNSRVYESGKKIFKKYNCIVDKFNTLDVKNKKKSIDKLLKNYNVIIFLRYQLERYNKNSALTLEKMEKLNFQFGLNLKNINNVNKNSIILHPGPINYGCEISHDVKNNKKIIANIQVENGIYVRMAILKLFL